MSLPQDIKSDLTPIALTSCLAKVLEGFTHRRLLKQVNCDIDPRQYAWEGDSNTQTLIYLLHAIHEIVETGNCCARTFFADYSKGFDIIDHKILVQELFLECRSDSVCLDKSLSDQPNPSEACRQFPVSMAPHLWWCPTGTKLGIALFVIMINRLLGDWHSRLKYFDDTTVFEVTDRFCAHIRSYIWMLFCA